MTKIFLDSGDPAQTKIIMDQLGFLHGQTTNPSLISKNPKVQACKESGECKQEDLLGFYKEIVQEMRSTLDNKQSISIEVYADHDTSAEEMIEQGMKMNEWISDAHIKLPINKAGLEAASYFVRQGMNVNMTLCFTLQQALAVHLATQGANKGQVYISPFLGRLDDRGESGIGLLKDIISTYKNLDSHVSVLAASVRNEQHVKDILQAQCDLVTIPFSVLSKYTADELEALQSIETVKKDANNSTNITLKEQWQDYDLSHDLTNNGITRFADDWNAIFTTNN